MIDSHAHLYFDKYDKDRDEVIRQCEHKLDAVINVGVDTETSKKAIELTYRSDRFFATIGFHPDEGLQFEKSGGDIVHTLESLYSSTRESRNRIVGIGEIGLDYHEQPPHIDKGIQKEVFSKQIEFAIEHTLPIVIHSRDAFEDTYEILQNALKSSGVTGVWHSFTEDPTKAKKILDLGLHIGINGIATFPSGKTLQTAIKEIPLDKILLETDAPFLAPQSVRGERNMPWYVEEIAEKIAEIKNVQLIDVQKQTDINTKNLFNINNV